MERMVAEALVPGCMGSFAKPYDQKGGLNRGSYSRSELTFHCREIPSWLMGQQGYSQVD